MEGIKSLYYEKGGFVREPATDYEWKTEKKRDLVARIEKVAFDNLIGQKGIVDRGDLHL